jgi:hypothetical protein
MASQADLDAIETAIARGERIVRHGDRMVEYRTVDEMIKAAGYMRAQISSAGGVTRSTYLTFVRD